MPLTVETHEAGLRIAALMRISHDSKVITSVWRTVVSLLHHPRTLCPTTRPMIHRHPVLERVETIEGVQRRLADVKAGRTKPARELFNRFRRKHGIPR